MRQLLIGCGNSRRKKMSLPEPGHDQWQELVTMDHDPNCGADIAHDLDDTPWPVGDNEFDEIYAFCVLEHLGQQGDFKSFFAHFHEIWRILKPGGRLFAFCPSYQSAWAWGDPSHRRVLTPGTMMFLDQTQYEKQVGNTAMTDFRWLWKGDFEPEHLEDDGERFWFILKARKGD